MVVAFLLCVGMALGAQSIPVPADEGTARDDELRARAAAIVRAHQTPRPAKERDVDVLHYNLELDLDLPARRIEGLLRISLRPWALPRRHITLDAHELRIESVRWKDGDALPFVHEASRLRIDLGRSVSALQTVELEIRYSANPRRGLIFVASDPRPDQHIDQAQSAEQAQHIEQAQPAEQTQSINQVWSQGQSEMTSSWFPCYDAPDDRARFSLHITVDEDLQTFSNGVLHQQEHAAGRRTDHWGLDFEFPVYLANLVVGHFEEIDLGSLREIPLRANASSAMAPIAAQALRHSGDAMAFLETLCGMPYPYPDYRQVLVSEYPYGGMENLSCTTLNERRLPAPASSWQPTPALDALIVHELAHQWWGNLLTCAQWSDLWLNEGFVSYAEVLYLEHRYGEDTARLHREDQRTASIDKLMSSGRPVVCQHYSSPDDLYDAHVYEAGAAFLQLLRGTLGDAAFFAGLQRWTQEAAGRSVLSHDLLKSFQADCERDLAPLFQQWLYAPGRPVLHCAWEWSASKKQLVVSLRQSQEGDGVPEVYQFPLDLSFMLGSNHRIVRVEVDQRQQRAVIACPEMPRYVCFNYGDSVPAQFHIDQLPSQWCAQLDAGHRATSRAQAARALGAWKPQPSETDPSKADPSQNQGEDQNQDEQTSASDESSSRLHAAEEERRNVLTQLCHAAMHDPSTLVRLAATEAVSKIGGPVALPAMAAAMHDQHPRVRKAGAQGLAQFKGHPEALDFLLRAYSLESVADIEATIVASLAQLGFPELIPVMVQILEEAESSTAAKGAALLGLCRLDPTEAEPRALAMAATGSERSLRPAAIEALGTLAASSPIATRTLVRLLDDPSLPLRFSAAHALLGVKDPALLADLVAAHEGCPFDDLQAAIARVIEGVLTADT